MENLFFLLAATTTRYFIAFTFDAGWAANQTTLLHYGVCSQAVFAAGVAARCLLQTPPPAHTGILTRLRRGLALRRPCDLPLRPLPRTPDWAALRAMRWQDERHLNARTLAFAQEA